MLDNNKTPEHYADAYVHKLLSQEEAAAVEERAKADKAWSHALEDAQRRHDLLKSLPPTEATEKLVQQTMAHVTGKVERRDRTWKIYSRSVMGLATAAALVIAAFHTYFYTMKPSPYDVRILGQNQLLSGTDAALRVAVFDQATGQPVNGVPVRLALFDRDSGEEFDLGDFTSGEDVAARFTLPDWEPGSYDLRVVAQTKGQDATLTESLTLRREWKLMLSFDKPVYQPGQTIHLRALAMRKPDLKPVSGEEMVFTVQDPKGNMVFKHRATGSEFGIAAADFSLATEIIEGPYNVACQVGDTVSEETVNVQKYVLPKFKVDVTVDKAFYQPGEQVAGTVQADYFFGQPVADSEVTIDVVTADVQKHSIASIVEKTDAQGAAAFKFALPDALIGREQDDGNARFALVAKVTDTAGQKYERAVSRIVTSNPIRLDVIPESGNLVKDVANKVYIFASYVDGRPAQVGLNVNGGEHETETNKLGVAEFELTPKSNELGLLVVATDKDGRIGREHTKLAVGQVASDFIVRTDKATYSGGDTVNLTALGGGVEPVFVDFLKDDQTILTTTVDMADGTGEHQFDLPAEMFGTIKLVAYRFGKAGVPVRKTKMIFVRQARTLNIAASLDKKEYRPGVSARLNLKLTDEDGQPVPGAISLAAVDEAVFAVLGQRPGMEQVFFMLEEELLEPVYEIYSWDPFAEPGGSGPMPEEVIELEQAIFSRTARATQGYDAVPDAFAAPVSEGDFTDGAWDGGVDIMEPMFMDENVTVVNAGGDANVTYVGGDESPFSLAAASYWLNHEEVSLRRRHGIAGSIIAWVGLLAMMVLISIATFAVYKPKAFLIDLALCIPLICVMGLVASATLFATKAASEGGFNQVDMAVMAEAPMAGAEQMEMDFMDGGADFGVDAADGWDAGGIDEMAANTAAEEPGAASRIIDTAGSDAAPAAKPKPRVREWFPETLLWRPEIVTDENGDASLEIPLADSITTWRLTTSAVSSGGQLGGGSEAIRVFQPFFVDLDLPVALTRNDQVNVPVVVYNYLDEAQAVTLDIKAADWFTRVDSAGMELESNEPLTLELAAGEIRSLHLPLRVNQVGKQHLQVTATGAQDIGDAIKRQIEVIPDGRRIEQVVSGTLDSPLDTTLLLPADAIEGSPRAIVKLYPTTFSQLVEGLDAIFQMPSGCFEQTSSTTYPNILALDYLRRTKTSAPEVEAKARQYINLGYQRLISFEVRGGGFDWFGNPPANETLTAYGLMEFEDMASVHDVDPALIDRTRDWLISKRQRDGRWKGDPNMLNDGLAGSVNQGRDIDLAATAYIAWAVFGSGEAKAQSQVTLDYLLSHEPASIDNAYLLALIANCIAGIDPDHNALGEYYARLDGMKQKSDDGKLVYWKQAEGARTMFYGDGRSGDIETTAMAALALMKSGQHSASVNGSLKWLIAQKDGRGTWHSTQATVLALKALVEATGTALGGDKARRIEIALDGEVIRAVDIPVDQAEVMQQINLTDSLAAGEQRLTITDTTKTGTGYQVAFWYHQEHQDPMVDAEPDPLSINIAYDREKLAVEDHVAATAIVVNNMQADAPMVILDLPIPGGFKIEAEDLQKLVGKDGEQGKIAKFQITPRKAIVYLRGLKPGEQLELKYRLRATMPVKVAVPAAAAYEYYNPDHRGESLPAMLEAGIDA
mgnify:FL=1